MAKRYTVEFNAKVTPVKPLNDEFTLCKCYVMALDKNRNLSYISKEAADAALPTLFNIPVIGHLYVDDEGKYHMGGHDMTIVQSDKGQLEFKSVCVPYGVVPQQDNVYYEDIAEPNGDIRTYIVSDVILWTGRFPELREAVYSNKAYFGQSMEINVNDYAPLDEDKNYTNIISYTYSALCMLGKSDNPSENVEPCFPMAGIEPYEFSLDNDRFSELMSQLKNELMYCFDGSIGEKGENMEDTNRSIDGLVDQTGDGDDTSTPVPDEKTAFSATYREKLQALDNIMPREREVDADGKDVRCTDYYICDFDETSVYVTKATWSTQDGYNEVHGKFLYTFDESNKTAALTSEFVEMVARWLTKEEDEALAAMRDQFAGLVEYKTAREKADREATFDAAIAEFAYLADIDEYKAVYESRYSYESVKALQDACYIVKGKYSVAAPQARKAVTEPIIPVGEVMTPASLHERFHERFGKK